MCVLHFKIRPKCNVNYSVAYSHCPSICQSLFSYEVFPKSCVLINIMISATLFV